MDNNILLSINFFTGGSIKKNAEIRRLLWEPLESLLFLLLSTIFWMVFLSDDYLGESLLEV
jgi:hypothetical protein